MNKKCITNVGLSLEEIQFENRNSIISARMWPKWVIFYSHIAIFNANSKSEK